MVPAEPPEEQRAGATARAENRGDIGGNVDSAAALVVGARERADVISGLDGSSAVTQASNAAVTAAESYAEEASGSLQAETRELVGGGSKEGNGNERAATGKARKATAKQAWAVDFLNMPTRLVKNFAGDFGGGIADLSSAAAVRRPRSSSL